MEEDRSIVELARPRGRRREYKSVLLLSFVFFENFLHAEFFPRPGNLSTRQQMKSFHFDDVQRVSRRRWIANSWTRIQLRYRHEAHGPISFLVISKYLLLSRGAEQQLNHVAVGIRATGAKVVRRGQSRAFVRAKLDLSFCRLETRGTIYDLCSCSEEFFGDRSISEE